MSEDTTDKGSSRQAVVGVDWFETAVDQEIAVDVLGGQAGAAVSRINGLPITTADPVDVGSAWVQLREDGRLTVNPNAGYAGRIAFECTVMGADARPYAHRAVVDVVGDPAAAGLAESFAMVSDIKLADMAANDNALDTDGLSQAGLYADMFKIVGSTLYLKAGVELDFGTRPASSSEVLGDGVSAVGGEHEGGVLLSDTVSDAFLFATGFADAGHKPDDDTREVIDLSLSGYATFKELLDSGALVQDGPDVVLTVDPADPLHSDKITLRGVDLSALSDSDFKF